MNKQELWEKYQHFFFLSLIVLLGAIIRFFLAPGTANSVIDGATYISLGYRVATGTLDLSQKKSYGFRFFTYIPIGISIFLFGLNDFAIMLPGILCSIGGIILVYILSRLLVKEKKIALLAALLIATSPLEIIYASAVTADMIPSFLISLTFVSFVFISKKETEKLENNKLYSLSYLTGIFLGAAYLARELSILLVPFFGLAFLWEIWNEKSMRKYIFLKYLFIAFGFITMNLFEFIFLYINTGYPFLRYYNKGWISFRTLEEFINDLLKIFFGTSTQASPLVSTDKLSLGLSRIADIDRYTEIRQLDRYIKAIVLPEILVGYGFYIFVFSLIAVFLNRKEDTYNSKLILITISWVLFALFYLQFGTANPFIWNWKLFEKQPRFLLTVSVPLWAIAAIGLLALPKFFNGLTRNKDFRNQTQLRKINGYLATFLIIFLIIFTNMLFAVEGHARLADVYPTKEIAEFLGTYPLKQIYVYPDSMIPSLRYHFASLDPEKIAFLNPVYTYSSIPKNCYIILSAEHLFNTQIPAALMEKSQNWYLLKEINKSQQSLFEGGFSFSYTTYIFYVPS